MKYYFAPLEGITNHVFRRTYDKWFGGIDAYYTPFVTTRDGGIMKKKELFDIMPENNPGIRLIPQIMTTKADEFVQAATHMKELGYDEVNLNLGCPSGTVVPKGKGSGFLRRPDELDEFLYNIYEKCPIDISIKSRIGFSDPEEFPRLLEIYNKYPVKLLVIHLRTREEWYRGNVHKESFEYAWNNYNDKCKLCYNGDIITSDDIDKIEKEFPYIGHVMIGRGYLTHPGFAGNAEKKSSFEEKKTVIGFIKNLQAEYEEILYGETPVLFKLKEIWGYLYESFPEDEKLFKRIKKTKHLKEYNDIINKTEAEL